MKHLVTPWEAAIAAATASIEDHTYAPPTEYERRNMAAAILRSGLRAMGPSLTDKVLQQIRRAADDASIDSQERFRGFLISLFGPRSE